MQCSWADNRTNVAGINTAGVNTAGVNFAAVRRLSAQQILYEDDEIIAVSKPAGMVVHPAPGSWNGTFVNALVYHLEQSGADGNEQGVADAPFRSMPDGEHNPSLRPGIVHRLDKGTTGVLLAAKNPTMQAKLAELFAQRRVSFATLLVGQWCLLVGSGFVSFERGLFVVFTSFSLPTTFVDANITHLARV